MIESLIELFDKREYFYIALAAIFAISDLVILGFSGFLMFASIGALFTSAFVFLTGSTDFLNELLFMCVATVFSGFLLWKPLKKIQNNSVKENTSSDMIGKVVKVTEDITTSSGKISYSGVDWDAVKNESNIPDITVDDFVEIVGVDGNLMKVKKS